MLTTTQRVVAWCMCQNATKQNSDKLKWRRGKGIKHAPTTAPTHNPIQTCLRPLLPSSFHNCHTHTHSQAFIHTSTTSTIASTTPNPHTPHSLQLLQRAVALQRLCNRRCSFCPNVVVFKAVHTTMTRAAAAEEKQKRTWVPCHSVCVCMCM